MADVGDAPAKVSACRNRRTSSVMGPGVPGCTTEGAWDCSLRESKRLGTRCIRQADLMPSTSEREVKDSNKTEPWGRFGACTVVDDLLTSLPTHDSGKSSRLYSGHREQENEIVPDPRWKEEARP